MNKKFTSIITISLSILLLACSNDQESQEEVSEESPQSENLSDTEENSDSELESSDDLDNENNNTEDDSADEEIDGETHQDEDNSYEHTIEPGDTIHSIAEEHDLDVDTLRQWNNILNPDDLPVGTTLSLDGPNEEQSQKEEWQIEFEQSLYDNYNVTVKEYEDIGDGYYGVYVNEVDSDIPYVTVNSETGDYTG